MPTFDLTLQKRRRIVVRNYREDGEHRGAVAVVSIDPCHGPVIRVSKRITLEGVEAILARVRADHGDQLDRWEHDLAEAAGRPAESEAAGEEPDAEKT